jgi:hypothetical protein
MKVAHLVTVTAFAALLAGCGAAEPSAPSSPPEVTATDRLLVVHKSPTCGCCSKWEEHVRRSGFAVESRNTDDLAAFKLEKGISPDMASCHKAVVDGYVLEGHVFATAVERLLRERPDAKGLAVPGMPAGSPGMDAPGRVEPYDVLLLNKDGTTEIFEHVPA